MCGDFSGGTGTRRCKSFGCKTSKKFQDDNPFQLSSVLSVVFFNFKELYFLFSLCLIAVAFVLCLLITSPEQFFYLIQLLMLPGRDVMKKTRFQAIIIKGKRRKKVGKEYCKLELMDEIKCQENIINIFSSSLVWS